jgi:glycosyltransferase involved in cell wall biosynthesis
MLELTGLRVCFIAGTLGQGGAERQLYYMLRVLTEHGAHPRVLCLTRGEYWEGPFERLGVSVTWVGEGRSRLTRLRRILGDVSRDSTDILQSQHFYANLYATTAAWLRGVPAIGAIRNDGINELGANRGLLGQLMLRGPRLIAANSQTGIRNATALGVRPENLRFLPNVVDTSQFAPHESTSSDRIRLLIVGRLVPQKRVDRFLRVLAATRKATCDGVRGIIVGDGPELPRLRRLASELDLCGDAVTFHGTSSDVGRFYREADLLVMTSDWEGTPNVALEAMASGLPVVATTVGGLPDVVRHEQTGLLADPHDELALIDGIVRLAQEPDLRARFGRCGRSHVMEHHSLTRLATELRELYSATIARHRR